MFFQKTFCAIMLLLIAMCPLQAQTAKGSHIDRVDTMGLIVLYPVNTQVELVCGRRPSRNDRSVMLMAEAAYTRVKPLRKKFSHANIHGIHVSRGHRYNGTPFDRKTGAFVSYGGKYKFVQLSTVDTATLQVTPMDDYKHRCTVFDTVARRGGMGFMQELIMYRGVVMPTVRQSHEKHQYRALCSHENRLCVIESDTVVTFGEFKQRLYDYGVSDAVYMDMGSVWNYAWYRDGNRIVELNPEAYYSRYCTNWIVFRRRR